MNLKTSREDAIQERNQENDLDQGGAEANSPHGQTFSPMTAKATLLKSADHEKDCFAFHCYNFYHHGTSLNKQSNGGSSDNDAELSAFVVQTFDKLCHLSHGTVDLALLSDMRRKTLQESGLARPISADRQLEFVNIRTKARSRVHEEQMAERKRLFWNTVASRIQSFEVENASKGSAREVERSLSVFCRKYRNVIGTHSLLAGMRTVLELQVEPQLQDSSISPKLVDNKNACSSSKESSVSSAEDTSLHPSRFCVAWTFDIAIITEHCSADDGLTYMVDCVDAISRIMTTEIYNEQQQQQQQNDITWQVQPNWSNRELTRFMNQLPLLKNLDAKPTGKVYMGNLKREPHCTQNTNDNHHGLAHDMCELVSRLGNCFRWTK